MEYYCGIDLGTSSVKVMLLGADGTVVGTASAGYDIKKIRPGRQNRIWNISGSGQDKA